MKDTLAALTGSNEVFNRIEDFKETTLFKILYQVIGLVVVLLAFYFLVDSINFTDILMTSPAEAIPQESEKIMSDAEFQILIDKYI